MPVLLTTEHLAWILDIQREWKGGRIDGNWIFEAQAPLSSAIVQERMDSRFPTIEHVMIWEHLLVAIGAR